jgi:hypothetical protein
MGWKGTLRSIAAAQRRAEREALRRQRELDRQRKQLQKMRELERAAYEVEVYENYIDILLSVHKECSNDWDWQAILSSRETSQPIRSYTREELARTKLNEFEPSFTDKLMGRVEAKRAERLKAVEEAKRVDDEEYQKALEAYAVREIASRILAGDFQAFIDAIIQTDPFSDISELGSSIGFQAYASSVLVPIIEATLHVNSEDVIPRETKTLLQSGRLSVKPMPTSRFNELYQDYVCGCVLRVARELFALLPIDKVIVTAVGNLLNTQTGHMEERPILSVAIPRRTLSGLNFETLDQSDSMKNFIHRMNFSRTNGFSAVEKIKPIELQGVGE